MIDTSMPAYMTTSSLGDVYFWVYHIMGFMMGYQWMIRERSFVHLFISNYAFLWGGEVNNVEPYLHYS